MLRTHRKRPVRPPPRPSKCAGPRHPLRGRRERRHRHLPRRGLSGHTLRRHPSERAPDRCACPVEDISLLDLSGKWPTVAEASANINSEPRPRCRRWSRAIYDAYPDLMGLRYASSMNGNEPAVALYERASKAIPRLPLFNRPLSDAPLLVPIERIAAELGYDLI